jgi:hypothetical protein
MVQLNLKFQIYVLNTTSKQKTICEYFNKILTGKLAFHETKHISDNEIFLHHQSNFLNP